MSKSSTKPKRDPAVAPLLKRLEANRPGLGMAIDDLLFATSCKGLKKISDEARRGMLDRLRLDDRFEVSEELGAPGGWTVRLRDEPPAEIVPTEGEDPVPGDESPTDTPIKTLGEKLAEAEANGKPPKETELAKPISAAPVPEAAKPLTDEEKHDLLFKAMEEHQKQGARLAGEFFDLKRQEASQDGALKITRETIKELQKTMASHMAAVPTLETIAQKKIEFDVGGEQAQPVPDDTWNYNVAADQVIPLDQIPGLNFLHLCNQIRGELPYQSEVHQIGSEVIEVKGGRYLLRESSMDDRRWFAQPVLTKDEWQQLHEEEYGRPLKDFDQNDEAKATRQAGGEDCGRLVRVSRSLCVLGPEKHGIVITVPDSMLPAPEGATTGKDAAAGIDQDDATFG